jgi:hypothetical protein
MVQNIPMLVGIGVTRHHSVEIVALLDNPLDLPHEGSLCLLLPSIYPAQSSFAKAVALSN